MRPLIESLASRGPLIRAARQEPRPAPGGFPRTSEPRRLLPGRTHRKECAMNSIIYIIGLVIVVLFIMGMLGLR